MGHLDYDSQTTPHPRFALISFLPLMLFQYCLLSLPYPIHRYVASLVLRSVIFFPFYIYRLRVYVYRDVIYTERVYHVAH